MAPTQPVGEIDGRFSAPGAEPATWEEVRAALEQAEIYWLSTVHPAGRPHVTPMIALWLDGAVYFCTGPDERKARNLAANPRCVVTTGCNLLGEGLDVVVEGEAVQVTDDDTLRRLAGAYVDKYGDEWRFDVRSGAFVHHAESLRGDDPGRADVYEVRPSTVFAFRRGAYSQTRWRFDRN